VYKRQDIATYGTSPKVLTLGKDQINSTCTVEITSNPQLKKYNAFISGIARQNATRLPAGLSATALHGAALALFAAVKPL